MGIQILIIFIVIIEEDRFSISYVRLKKYSKFPTRIINGSITAIDNIFIDLSGSFYSKSPSSMGCQTTTLNY